MFNIAACSVEKIRDPYQILSGERFELILDLDVEEDDELYLEEGVSMRVVYVRESGSSRMVSYEFLNRTTNQYINMEMEEDEQDLVTSFCQEELKQSVESQ